MNIPPEIINMTLQFMQRVDLKGAEVEAYVTVVQTLQEALKSTQESTESSTQEQTPD